ncbi:hypothetical protein KSF_098910 [Reticulibacter mediterranei]|uniref:Uncharacterized protein n=1 Tax=Reticulibacter mediterranei TaxID=2778369 RepID=A0A8J3ISV5_9CHLR|nr:hypothetical protein KSF_098910 [Reticulibacter mediterranei]
MRGKEYCVYCQKKTLCKDLYCPRCKRCRKCGQGLRGPHSIDCAQRTEPWGEIR